MRRSIGCLLFVLVLCAWVVAPGTHGACAPAVILVPTPPLTVTALCIDPWAPQILR
jgi:hypothetical protein